MVEEKSGGGREAPADPAGLLETPDVSPGASRPNSGVVGKGGSANRPPLGVLLADQYQSVTIAAGARASLSARLVAPPANDASSQARGAPPADAGIASEGEGSPNGVIGAVAAEAVAEWDWALEGREVDFSASFTPDEPGAKSVAIVPEGRHLAADGPVEGRFSLPPGCTGGTLRFEWSNYFSYLRQKVVNYRLSLPPGCAATPVTMA